MELGLLDVVTSMYALYGPREHFALFILYMLCQSMKDFWDLTVNRHGGLSLKWIAE